MRKLFADVNTKFFIKIMSAITIICLIISFITKDIIPFTSSIISTIIIFTTKWSIDKKYKYTKEDN